MEKIWGSNMYGVQDRALTWAHQMEDTEASHHSPIVSNLARIHHNFVAQQCYLIRINFRITPPPRSNLYFTYYHPQSSY